MIPSYLNPEELVPGMRERPWRPFLVRPSDYTIIDGDTFRIRTNVLPETGKRAEAFRIRLPSVDTPELLKPSLFDRVMERGGVDCHLTGPGEFVRDRLRDWCSGKVILVDPLLVDGMPQGDRYHRLLAGVHVSGSPGNLFDVDGAWSVEHVLLSRGMACLMRGAETPDPDPPVLRSIRAWLEETSEAELSHGAGPQL